MKGIKINGKIITLDNITLEDIEQLFEFDRDTLLKHRLELGQQYIEIHFPENQKLFKKLQQSIKRNIKLTDPKTFKNVADVVPFRNLLSVDYVNNNEKPKRKLKLQSRNKKTAARFLKKPKLKTKSELIDEKIQQLDIDMKKTQTGD
jgi:hypothetical protein